MDTLAGLTFLDRIMMAITFAESGDAATARFIMENRDDKRPRQEKAAVNRPELRL